MWSVWGRTSRRFAVGSVAFGEMTWIIMTWEADLIAKATKAVAVDLFHDLATHRAPHIDQTWKNKQTLTHLAIEQTEIVLHRPPEMQRPLGGLGEAQAIMDQWARLRNAYGTIADFESMAPLRRKEFQSKFVTRITAKTDEVHGQKIDDVRLARA